MKESGMPLAAAEEAAAVIREFGAVYTSLGKVSPEFRCKAGVRKRF